MLFIYGPTKLTNIRSSWADDRLASRQIKKEHPRSWLKQNTRLWYKVVLHVINQMSVALFTHLSHSIATIKRSSVQGALHRNAEKKTRSVSRLKWPLYIARFRHGLGTCDAFLKTWYYVPSPIVKGHFEFQSTSSTAITVKTFPAKLIGRNKPFLSPEGSCGVVLRFLRTQPVLILKDHATLQSEVSWRAFGQSLPFPFESITS